MSARCLLVEHSRTEGAGYLGEWLPAAGLAMHTVRPNAGDALPERVNADALVVMGGAMGAYEDDAYPWMAAEKAMIRRAVDDGVAVLGVCLGGQLLAAACGGTVEPGPAGPELGARLVAKQDAAWTDPLFAGVPLLPDVVQWHWDAVTALPPNATLLLKGTTYPHQAFRVGARAWGIQFHLETPESMVRTWADHDAERVRAVGLDPDALVAGVAALDLEATWRGLAEAFAGVATGRVAA